MHRRLPAIIPSTPSCSEQSSLSPFAPSGQSYRSVSPKESSGENSQTSYPGQTCILPFGRRCGTANPSLDPNRDRRPAQDSPVPLAGTVGTILRTPSFLVSLYPCTRPPYLVRNAPPGPIMRARIIRVPPKYCGPVQLSLPRPSFVTPGGLGYARLRRSATIAPTPALNNSQVDGSGTTSLLSVTSA